MHQLIIQIQGGEHASLSQVIQTLDHLKARLIRGDTQGASHCAVVGYEFEVREVDHDHALRHLLHPKQPRQDGVSTTTT